MQDDVISDKTYHKAQNINFVYENWHTKQTGFTRSTMDAKLYTQMMARLNKAGKRRSNYAVTTKNGPEEYRKMKAVFMKNWRQKVFCDNIET
jgi:hypothetical protein